MRTISFVTVLALLGVAGCAMEEEGCYTSEDCGDGWICDTATGACVPIEECDADVAGNESSLPDTMDGDVSDLSDGSDLSDNTVADADTTADKDAAVDADTLPTDSDALSDSDTATDVSDLSDGSDLSDNTVVDEDTAADEDDTAADETPDTDTVTDTVPDTDTSCTGCACEDCSGHGTCTTANGYVECLCDTGYAGSWCQQCDYAWQDRDGNGICEKDDCAHATAPVTGWLDCGAHGTCDDMSGMSAADCDCDTYWIDQSGGECNYCWASDPGDC